MERYVNIDINFIRYQYLMNNYIIWWIIHKFIDKSKFKGRNKFKYRNESLIQSGGTIRKYWYKSYVIPIFNE